MLHAMERKGYLSFRQQRKGRTVRKLYRATRPGRRGLSFAKVELKEFTGKTTRI
jgi:PadR family transcriptional regulator, regulatory protein PadR